VYRLAGCRVRSAVPLPALPVDASSGPPYDIEIVRTGLDEAVDPTFPADWTLEQGSADRTPLRGSRIWSRPAPDGRHYRYRFDYCGHAAEFVFNPNGSEIRAAWTEQVSEADVAMLLTGPVLGRALRLRGVHCLHATTVTIEGHAVSLLGPSGAGKSTFAAALVQGGSGLLSDDQTAFVWQEADVHALPGQRGLKLWSDSVQNLDPSGYSARLMWPGIEDLEKFVVELPGAQGAEAPAPVAGVYLLGPRRPEVTEVEISELPPAQRVAVLCANVYGGMEPSRELRVREIAFFSRMAGSVPVRSLRLPHGLDRIADAADAFIDQVRAAVA
jgi:hypothetical protein